MRVFADQLCKREVSPAAAMLAAQGIYLMNGGTKEGLNEMTADDLQLIYTTYTSMRSADNAELVEGIIKLLKKE